MVRCYDTGGRDSPLLPAECGREQNMWRHSTLYWSKPDNASTTSPFGTPIVLVLRYVARHPPQGCIDTHMVQGGGGGGVLICFLP